MFKKYNKKEKSPRTLQMLNHFIQNQQNNNQNNDNKSYMNQNINLYNNNNNNNDFYNNNTTNNKLYSINTLSQGNKSFMTASQLLDYSLANDELKRKKTLGILDMTSHRNKNIFIETDSEQYNSRRNSIDSNKKKPKRYCSKLLVDKVTSHIPNTYHMERGNNNIQNIQNIPSNQYSIKTFRTFNDINLNELNDDLNSDTYEYEKSEIIKIKKVNYLPNEHINNKRIEEKRIVLSKIKNKTPYSNKIKYELNNPNTKRTNNISNASSDHKYPFVIPTKKKNSFNQVYHGPVNNKNYIPNNRDINTEPLNNQFVPQKYNYNDNISLSETSDVVTPLKQTPFGFKKKRIYNDNDKNENENEYNNTHPYNLKLYNNKNNNEMQDEPQYNTDNYIDSDVNNSYRYNPDKNYYNYSKFKTLYIKKEKQYNNLLEDYNDIVAKYNKLQGLYNKLYNDRDNDRENDKDNDNNNEDNNNDLEDNVKKKNKLMDNIAISPMKNLASSKSENNLLNHIYKVEPVEDRLQNFIYDKDNYKNKLNDLLQKLKIEKNNNIFILNKNKKEDILYKFENESFDIINNKKINLNNKNNNKFDDNNLIEEKNNRIQLNYENKFFDENKLNVNKINEIILKPIIKDSKELNIYKTNEINLEPLLGNKQSKNNYNISNYYFEIINNNKNLDNLDNLDNIITNENNGFKMRNIKSNDENLNNNYKDNFVIEKQNNMIIILDQDKDKNNIINNSKYFDIQNLSINKIISFDLSLSKLSKNKKKVVDSSTEPIKELNQIMINRENELKILSEYNNNIKELEIIKEYNLEIISENKLEKNEKNNFEIVANDCFYLFNEIKRNKQFKDLDKFEIKNDSNIFYFYKDNNIKKNILEINYNEKFNIINIKDMSEKESNENNLNIENNNLFIPSSDIKKLNLFNENNLINENNININLINNKKIILLKSKTFSSYIKSDKKPSKLSINPTTYFNYDIDLIAKNKNKINEFNKLSSINNLDNFIIKNKIKKNNISKNNTINKCISYYIHNNNNKKELYEIINVDNINYVENNKKQLFEQVNVDNINYGGNNEDKENKDINNNPLKYSHIIDEINNEYPNKLNMNQKLNKGKNSVLSKLKKNGLDIKINKLKNNPNNNISSNSSINNSLIISDNEKPNKNIKGDIIEQNIDRILTQNKSLYLNNLFKQKEKKEKKFEKIFKDDESLLQYYFLKWKNSEKDIKNRKLKNMFRKYALKDWNKDIENFMDEYMEDKNMNSNKKNKKINKDFEFVGIPDLNYIRNKLHVSVVKRIKITEEEINKFKEGFNIIDSIFRKYFFKNFFNIYQKE